MYIFQSLFNLVVTSNSGQAALTMPIMAPLADLVGVSRQVAVLAYQLGAGFMDAFTPVSASLIGVLGVARIVGKMGKIPNQNARILFCPRYYLYHDCDSNRLTIAK